MSLLILSALAACCLTPTPDDAVKKDLAAMEGEWTLVAMEVDGKAVDSKKLQGAKVTISGNKYTHVTRGKQTEIELKLDPSKSPKEIDMTFLDGPNKDRVGKGIYDFDNGKLRICRSLDPQDERPKDFKTEGKNNYFVMVWEKQ